MSVFLALTITLMLSFCMVLIESARENTMLLKADIIFHTGTQSIMAEYHRLLWERYELLYIDCSYGTEAPDYEKVKQHLEQYVQKNIGDDQGWLGLEYDGARVKEVLLATDFEAGSYYEQAVEAGKSGIGISYVERILQYLEKTQENQNVEIQMSQDKEQASKTIQEANGTRIQTKEAVWGIDEQGEEILLEEPQYKVIDVQNPLNQILSANVLVKQILSGQENHKEVSDVRIEQSKLPSVRKLAVGTLKETEVEGSLLDKVYFIQYLIEHFSSYMDSSETDRTIRCELEYLLSGRSSDAQNMEVVMAKLLAIREVDNYLLLLQDEVRKMEAHALAASAAAASLPVLEPAIYQATLLYWAYEDSVHDLQKLFRGEAVPLLKSVGAFSDFCLKYEQYLMILLLLEDTQKLSMRSMDMIELAIRQEQEFFRLDGCISQAEIEGVFRDTCDKEYIVNAKVRY